MENVRYNISPCSKAEAEEFVGKIDKTKYVSRGAVFADEHSHYDRYAFIRDELKVAVVYDTTAQVISITAPAAFAEELLTQFGAGGRTVKRSTVPATGSSRAQRQDKDFSVPVESGETRAKLFVSPDSIRRRPTHNAATVIATKTGLEISTDEIFPPQRAKPRVNVNTSTVERSGAPLQVAAQGRQGYMTSRAESIGYTKAPSVDAYFERTEKRPVGRPKKATISFGDDEESEKNPSRSLPYRSGTGLYADIASSHHDAESAPVRSKHYAGKASRIDIDPDPEPPPPSRFDRDHAYSADPEQATKKRRGRPPKDTAQADIVVPPAYRDGQSSPAQAPAEQKNGYSVSNYSAEKLSALLKRLKTDGYAVSPDGVENAGSQNEIKRFIVSDLNGIKVYIRYAAQKRMLWLQGKRSELFGELQSQVGMDSDYSSALEGYIGGNSGAKNGQKVSDVESKLKKRLPTAYKFLSEQSCIDFSYGIHDFSQNDLRLSDYSVLLVPPFRGLERFIFDLQRAEGIKVKMIGQAYDKDDSGRYVLKNGYRARIGSVVYCEVMVALYTEYFSRRNFFAHSDNSDDDRSRAIPDRLVAKRIFENLLDTVEYNAKKLNEIGFVLEREQKSEQ